MKKVATTFFATILVVLLTCGIVPVLPGMSGAPTQVETAYADPMPDKTVSGLVVSSLRNPNTGNGGWVKVYYGNARSPLRFKVLNTHETVFGGETLLLDCDSIISRNYAALWWDYHWEQSQLEGATYFATDQRLTDAEFGAVRKSTKEKLAPGDVHPVYDPQGILDYEFDPVRNDEFFILDAAEAMNVNYGFPANRNATDLRKKSGDGSDYWLRSKSGHWSQADSVAYVKSNGGLTKKFAGNYSGSRKTEVESGISPAMNINLSQILFTTLVSGVAGQPGSEYKLTILDNTPYPHYMGDLGIDTKVGTVKRHGNDIEVPFTVSGKRAQNVNRISYLITDKAWNAEGAKIIAYDSANLTSGSVASGSASFTLPAAYDRDNHHVYFFAEDVNGGNLTDFASNPVKLNIPPATIKVEATPYEGVYDGQAHTIGISYEPNYATIKYGTTEGTYDLDALPSYTDAGEYTIYYQVTAEDYEPVVGSATVKIIPRALTVNGTQIKDKVYDGTTASEVDVDPEVTNKVTGDDVDVVVTGIFHDANAGANKPVTLQYELTGTKAANYVISPNSEQEATATIDKRVVTVDGITGVDKVDDDYLNVELDFDEVVIDNMIEGDDLGVTAQGNMGPGYVTLVPQTVFIHHMELTGSDADNYRLDVENSQDRTTATIWPNGYTIVNVSEKTHVYDGQPHTIKVTTKNTMEDYDPSKITVKYSATEGGPWQTEPITATDVGTITIYFQVRDENIYDETKQTIEGASILKITPKPVLVSEMTEFTKVYDGTTNAPAGYDFSTATIGGKVDGDDVYVASGSAVYTNPNAGDRLVLLSGMTLGGTKSGNYTLEPGAQIMGTITPRPITVSGVTASDKVYDGTNAVEIQASNLAIQNVLDGDDVTISSVAASFESPDVNVDGEGNVVARTVNISYGLGGADVDNYYVDPDSSQTTTAAVIFRKDLAIGGGNTYWDYDGQEHGGATGYVDDPVEVEILYGEPDGICDSPESPTFKNAGMHLVQFLVVSKNNNYNDGSGLLFVNIAPRPLVVTGVTADNKNYDGTTDATLNTDGMEITNIVDGDDVSVTVTGAFEDAKAGEGKKIPLSFELTGDARSNYYIDEEESQLETAADIILPIYTITYALGGGTLDGKTGSVKEEHPALTSITLPEPTRDGYTFLLWDNDGAQYQTGDTFTVEANSTFTAQWKKNASPTPVNYTITYKLNGGSYNGSTADIKETYEAGTKIEIHAEPTRAGYTFLYWEGSEYQPGDSYTVTDDHTFTARWQKDNSGSDDSDSGSDDQDSDGEDSSDQDSSDSDNSDEGAGTDTKDRTNPAPGKKQGVTPTASAKTTAKPTANTGDEAPLFGLFALLVVSAGSLVALKRRRLA